VYGFYGLTNKFSEYLYRMPLVQSLIFSVAFQSYEQTDLLFPIEPIKDCYILS
jgi:hypothetical protein